MNNKMVSILVINSVLTSLDFHVKLVIAGWLIS
ncbi:hypothetical protein J2X14_001497 [Pantoea alhagi]|nr:hypothetical protein [Pantoea alhagi]